MLEIIVNMTLNSKNNSNTNPYLKTIRCYVSTGEDERRKVWEEMTQKNTPMIVQLLKDVSEQPEFEAHKAEGNIVKNEITKLRKSLQEDVDWSTQSGRLGTSADNQVQEVYSSWLILYKQRKTRKEGLEYFLNNILKSDLELIKESNSDLQAIRSKAQEILNHPEDFLKKKSIDNAENKQSLKSQKQSSNSEQEINTNNKNLTYSLFAIHRVTEDSLTKCAVAYLIKNNNKISNSEENIQKLKERRTEQKVEIKRLEKQIKDNRLPNGRDITGRIYTEAFDNLVNQVPQNNEDYSDWIANFLKEISSLPYPIKYLYDDIHWYKNDENKIFVYFNGWSDYHFQICCHKRQRHFFERFLEDYKAYKASKKDKEKLSGSLITLRSVQLLWQPGEGNGEPWNVNKLALHCTYDTRLWTAEGTEEVRQEKTVKTQQQVNKARENKKLDKSEEKNLKKKESSLSRLQNSFIRPSKPVYQGQSHIVVGVSFHPVDLATVAVVDVNTKKLLVCQTIKQLLGENYHLVSRRRRQQVHLRKERQRSQKKDAPCKVGESKLGEYIDKLLAKRIVEVATKYQAGCIVLPRLKNMTEIRTSVIQAKAETKFPGNVNKQKLYVKEYNRQIHNWSYRRLQKSIKSKAAELNISIKFGKQPYDNSLQEQARELAFSAY